MSVRAILGIGIIVLAFLSSMIEYFLWFILVLAILSFFYFIYSLFQFIYEEYYE